MSNNNEKNVINVFEAFSGIGAQHKAITNIKKSFKIQGTSEWDARAIISYSLIHHFKKFNKKLKEIEKWAEVKINKYLANRTFSLDSKKPSDVRRKDRNFKNNLIAANIVNNNFSDICQIKAEDIEGTDLLTYSFPCQGLSIANMGRGKGIKQDSNSTSNLIWQIKRILDDTKDKKIKLPKYLLLENVKALIGSKHIDDFNEWKKYLKSIGYQTQSFVLSGIDHGNLQKRERVFAISILKKKLKNNFIDGSNIKKIILKKYSKSINLKNRKIKYFDILNSSTKDEIEISTPKNTTSRIRMKNQNSNLIQEAEKRKYYFNTLTTKQDRHPNIGMIPVPKKEGKLDARFITPREGYSIMGFSNEDFNNVKTKYLEGILNKESLYRQAGNSIVVEVLEDVFKFIYDFERGNI